MAIRTMGPSGQYETGLDAAGAVLPELLAPAGGLDQMLAAIAAGADALIVADAGLACALSAAIPGVEIHLSTQAGVHSEGAVRLAADELGVERVTTARELTVDEIAALCATGVPIEVFCHGAICIGYSGACEFSALRRGRSAMRGDCAQPCRLAYDLVDEAGRALSPSKGIACCARATIWVLRICPSL